MGSDKFPLLGFPAETNERCGTVVYQCFFINARIALWRREHGMEGESKYQLNLYKNTFYQNELTHPTNRYRPLQLPIKVNDAMEAQLAINFLIQRYNIYNPLEVT
jgi:hypothetical protein